MVYHYFLIRNYQVRRQRKLVYIKIKTSTSALKWNVTGDCSLAMLSPYMITLSLLDALVYDKIKCKCMKRIVRPLNIFSHSFHSWGCLTLGWTFFLVVCVEFKKFKGIFHSISLKKGFFERHSHEILAHIFVGPVWNAFQTLLRTLHLRQTNSLALQDLWQSAGATKTIQQMQECVMNEYLYTQYTLHTKSTQCLAIATWFKFKSDQGYVAEHMIDSFNTCSDSIKWNRIFSVNIKWPDSTSVMCFSFW